MLKNYLKVAFRNLLKNKGISFINVFGLSMGMAVTMLIGLWIWSELSFDKYHQNYDRIATVWQRQSLGNQASAFNAMPIPLAAELRASYPDDFKQVVIVTGGQHTIAAGEKKFTKSGCFMEPGGPDLLSLKMLKGSRTGLKEPSSVLLSASLATSLFGDKDPMDQFVKLDNNNKLTVKVTGVYEDLPNNTTLSTMAYIAPWELFVSSWDWVKNIKDIWDANAMHIYVQLADNTDFNKVSQKIKDVKARHSHDASGVKTALFLHPMNKWHLYSSFVNGVNVGGQIQYVRLFGLIGIFVLLLACINFMNLSTARSEKRAKEVGIRKAIGSVRSQLIWQFLSESILVAVFSFVLSLLLVILILPWFNKVADKDIHVLWTSGWFWLAGIGFSLFTGFIAGSYPALYLSSFQPLKVLKGTFKAGRFAAVPRKALIVVQFSVSILLIIGTVIVYRQIQFAKDRPVGYTREGLLAIQMTTPEIYQNYNPIQNELMSTGTITAMAESQGPLTDIWSDESGFEWQGKVADQQESFATIGGKFGYGKTIGWHFKAGRDFSQDFATDSMGLILNEASVKYMGLKNPVGETIKWNGQSYHVLGVVENMIMTSPYEPVQQAIYYLLKEPGNFINLRINPNISTSKALVTIGAVFQKYNPGAPFEYKFIDQEYAKKFSEEERIGKLATFFAILAILISCLGLFGLASFLAEQRTKEIGIRKVMGASVFQLWQMLSKDFVVLVSISCCIAVPVAWYFLANWLQRYNYHTTIVWEIFAVVGAGALLIALLTVSYQAIKAAMANPVKSLRAE
ncbi:ABC-type antimicrobial peptide transport system permease subunit [Chitinophaga niastensis]|uniref:ABC-type antimicrobial peptide transport system permease subunit n=1 Tax=Chitinophaga niastensis TaxID=536980 RepID=A0A2P8HV02_CHINA|nr:ABC transporter permease [Chitinophaga niastensis]PSL49984.1 ABC-type antimicrobial peptide transport system permease subunit [Chitinophaga niastensis]